MEYHAEKYFCYYLFLTLPSNAQEDRFPLDSLPYDAIINSTLGGKRMKYFGKLDLTLSQAYFENWVSGGKTRLMESYTLIIISIIPIEKDGFGTTI